MQYERFLHFGNLYCMRCSWVLHVYETSKVQINFILHNTEVSYWLYYMTTVLNICKWACHMISLQDIMWKFWLQCNMKFIALRFQNEALYINEEIPLLLHWIFGVSCVKIYIALQYKFHWTLDCFYLSQWGIWHVLIHDYVTEYLPNRSSECTLIIQYNQVSYLHWIALYKQLLRTLKDSALQIMNSCKNSTWVSIFKCNKYINVIITQILKDRTIKK